MNRRLAPFALVVVLALAAACYTLDPVRERLEIRLQAGGRVTVLSETRIDDHSDEAGAPPAMKRRLERLRGDIESGQDDWSRILAAGRCRRLSVSHEWEEGALTASRREAELELEGVPELFRNSDVEAWLTREEGWTELSLAPSAPSRATREQRQAVAEALGRFVEAEARYVKAMGALYAWIDENPGSAEECFSRLLGDDGESENADDEETRLLRTANDSMLVLADFFFIEEGQDGYSIDALVRAVHDPFPAELTIVLPSPPLQSEGFERREDLTLRVAPLSLRSAIESMKGRWVQPDVVAIALPQYLDGKEPELAALASEARRAVGASEDEIRQALTSALEPAGLYRVRWATPPP